MRDLDELVRASPEGHGAEFTRDATGRKPWRELVLYDGENRGWDANTCGSFPKTRALLRDAPSLITVPAAAPKPRYCCRVSVLRLAPGARVNVHTAPTNVRLKAHLVLSTPANAFLQVAGERRNYSESELLVFDDSFFPRPRTVMKLRRGTCFLSISGSPGCCCFRFFVTRAALPWRFVGVWHTCRDKSA